MTKLFSAAVIGLLIMALEASTAPLSVSRCKKRFIPGSSSQFVGRAAWQDEARQTIVGTTEERTVGRSVLSCAVKLPAASTSAALDFGAARIAFGAPTAAAAPIGLEIAVLAGKSSVCTISGLRVHRENWMELGPATYALQFPAPVDRVTVIFTLHDPSPNAALRADINALVVRPRGAEETVLPCPPAVR
jgi:hypothetical protein